MLIFRKHTPRWIIFFIDVFIGFTSIVLAYMLRFNFNIKEIELEKLIYVIPIVIGVRIAGFLIGKTYAGIIRYTSTKDAERIFIVITSGSLLFVAGNVIRFYFFDHGFIIPFSIIIIDFMTSILFLTAFRLLVKMLYIELNHPLKDRTDVVIYGTDQLAIITKRTIDRDVEMNQRVVAFVDSTNRNVKNKLEGVTIYNVDNLSEIFQKHKVSKLIIAKPNISSSRKNEVIDICLHNNVKVLSVPDSSAWINGELSFNQIKNVRIEDLLGREQIKLDEKRIKMEVLNKTVLVTGAAGSIGSEIVRQLTKYNPQNIILYDQAESPLYDLELELTEKLNFQNFKIIIGDITNINRLRYIFGRYNPVVVYHAAAYKHVPMMEKNPAEAVMTNILGTKNVADLSSEYNVRKFVMISTDKAVNPTNVMGASKRIAEMYTQYLNLKSETSFIITRFGNVLGSTGSVIPRFRSQIENGGPITITHPEITRFFMTIPEACQLVLEAGSMGNGGEIYLFDMGESVKIIDLAKKMIKLSGLELGKDINIKYTGLRPGEKLYEELLFNEENSLPTHHNQIMIAKVNDDDLEEKGQKIQDLIQIGTQYQNYEIVAKMKELVPEFKSKNSVYETLDNSEK
ncbi:MAG: nucleoside-diphosphate sugar epimerase/dehydratase [Bacteroidota bacterium]